MNEKLLDETRNKTWNKICQIHLITKHFSLIAEELNQDSNVFFQPIKEHRDAYDHIIRTYSLKHIDNASDISNPVEYVASNMGKALGHEYRAFFDTADWLAIACRERIVGTLKDYNKEEILRRYPAYLELKEYILDVSEQIAAIREGKDVSKDMLKGVEEYVEILDKIIAYTKDINKTFE